jgi:CheY-like chemotaxis protein
MLVIDGIEAPHKICEQGCSRAKVPIVTVPSNAMAGDRERYIESGMNDYVPKPVNRRALIQALNRYILPSGNAA